MPTSSELKKRGGYRGNSDFRLSLFAILFMALSMVATVMVGNNGLSLSRAPMGVLTVAVLCEAASWMGLPLIAWLLFGHFENWGIKPRYLGILLALALVCEPLYDYVSSGSWMNWRSQNPIFALVISCLVLAIWDWLGRFEEFTRWIWRIIAVIIGLTWIFIFRLGFRQELLYQGITLLGFVLIFRSLEAKENTMIYAAGVWGALGMLMPGIGVLFLHSRNNQEGYPHPSWRWMLAVAYPLLLLLFTGIRFFLA